MSDLSCRTDARREAVRRNEGWNGLDFVEVDDAQTTLTVLFLGRAPEGLTRDDVAIEGGRTEKDRVTIVDVEIHAADDDYFDDYMLVYVDKPGDYSTYTLRLVGLEKIDPRYASVEFSFKASCPTDLDCAETCKCPPDVFEAPVIDYLAKDYAGFRQLILDRLSLICPDWRERHVPDLGIALVEVLAYVGDYLSYYQDAVATEAYLDTARRRPSVRRHARLVDYRLSEGCNARALVVIETGADLGLKVTDVRFITGVNHLIPIGDAAALPAHRIEGVPPEAYEVFLPIAGSPEIRLWKASNAISFYTWGGRECCLRKGATRATLRGRLATASPDADDDGKEPGSEVHLGVGALLVFEEVLDPVTGKPEDADPRHRQGVRLTKVGQSHDELLDEPVIEIGWSEEDALTFDLCISAMSAAPECRYVEDVTIARGNVVLVDHGRDVGLEDLGTVPTRSTSQCCECEGQPTETETVPGRYRPQLISAPLTFAAPAGGKDSAAALLRPNPRDALPVVELAVGGSEAEVWEPRYDLLWASGGDRQFVVEMEENGVANIRFGDGELGMQPTAGGAFTATYRVGNGPAGNVGAGAISVLVHAESDLGNDILRVRNPLPAAGGTAAEPMAEARLNAPFAFRFGPDAMQRAITAADYADIAARNATLQGAAARLAWSGSWYDVEVGVDVRSAYAAEASAIAAETEARLEGFRRLGHDLDVRVADHVPVDLALKVCVAPGYLRGHVKAALLDAFGNRVLPDGRFGFFHADSLTFGEGVFVSRLVAAAQATPGVASVEVSRLQRQFEASNREIENGVLALGHLEIAQLENDPNHPDRGKLEIVVAGGR